ncbi:MAG TPA: ABC transporter substrate-binding protein, partial [Candidatus Polarisedimenticolia bacterium]|nr:ABC transporter substrate-binding protein [Candidatus Polarisedimenticolia bacterium]
MRTLDTRTSLSGRARAALLLPIALLGFALSTCTRRASTPKKPEQVFRFRMHEDPPTLDPALSNDEFSDSVVLNVNRGLVELDPGTLEIRPAIAESWSVSPDNLEYTFHLRDNARFHNGRALTSQDVAYSFLRLLKKETQSPRRFLLEPVEGAQDFSEGKSPAVKGLTTPDDRTVVLRLAKPFAPFLSELTMVNASILPKEAYDDPTKAYLRAPVGCGPFRLARWEQSNFIELLPFDGYYGGRPALD